MDLEVCQRRIDAIEWYHEFDFPNGLVARATTLDAEAHRRIWRFITSELDRIDFTGKSVLDLGCWDGYWSFYAERRGAEYVLATDDRSQNWAGSAGVLLARELLDSSIDIRLDVSVYDAARVGRTFDIVLCLGIYYHLVDPFYAFSQIRRCCHPGSIVVFEGDCTHALAKTSIHYDLADPSMPIFLPAPEALAQMLQANYLNVVSQRSMLAQLGSRPEHRGAPNLLRRIWPKPSRPALRSLDRLISVCEPFEGSNPLHFYRPPFGLHEFDPRFQKDDGLEPTR